MELQRDFEQFVADEGPAIEELRHFVGGELGPRLDASVESLELLDRYIHKLTEPPGWESDPLFAGYGSTIRPWLTVRLAYYLARVIKESPGGQWRLEAEEPVLDLGPMHISPLEVAHSYLDGDVGGGLSGFTPTWLSRWQSGKRVSSTVDVIARPCAVAWSSRTAAMALQRTTASEANVTAQR